MKNATRYTFFFGVYMLANGILLMLIPQETLHLFHIELTTPLWARVTGVLTAILGYLYLQAAKAQSVRVFRISTHGRLFASSVFIGLVMIEEAPILFLLLAAIDFISATLTLRSLANIKE
jgi:hypothetical protein